MISRTENRSSGNTTEATHIADDDADLGPSLNDLLSSDDLIEYNMGRLPESVYLSASRARYAQNHDRPMIDRPMSTVDISMPDPYATYYSTELLARANSHGDEYAASAMRYAPRYNINFYHLKMLGSVLQLYKSASNI